MIIPDASFEELYDIQVDINNELIEKNIEQQQTIQDLAEALNEACSWSSFTRNRYQALAAQHIKNPIGESLAKEIHDQGC